ncbi:hypothetical protein BCR36DRAFT_121446 [Piromyces finnis]|uniref:F-box domain-containing protein n=1 Tax=Piromyces finnis TaxID=1754191 RepID=A0A1Y1V1Z4_9FUNG|nr:hypothetical protein BCR36DRAFT_121446 [Piromyces finnis]|eukprot:ORX44818.1 hypothetical protein BCR36DRAFT_121446 [Piromyces finnis]
MENKLSQMKNIIEVSLVDNHSSISSKKRKIERNQIFPNEILFKIFSYCDIDTLFHSIPYVSWQWNTLLTKMSFAGQINLKIYDDEQFKKLYSKSKSFFSSHYNNPYAMSNTSYGYSGYSSYGSYGGLSNYDNFSSYSNYNSYGNYDGHGSFNGYGNFNDYNSSYYSYGNGTSSSFDGYSMNFHRKDKEIADVNDVLEPNYQIELLDSKQFNSEISMPVIFQINLALPLSFIIASEKESNTDNSYDDYFSYNISDNEINESSSTSSNSKKNKETKSIMDFNLEPIQDYLDEKQKEIKQFRAFYYIYGIEISIDTDKVIVAPTNQNNNNTSENQTTSSSNETLSAPTHQVTGINNNTQNESESSSNTISNSVEVENIIPSTEEQQNSIGSTNETHVTPTNPIHPEDSLPNSTMILTELLLEKYRFTPEILKIQNVQWSNKFVHIIPKSVKKIEIKYLGNPDPEILKEGTNYLYTFIKNLSISSSSILRPRARRTNRHYYSSVNRTSITVN